ncbi:hypothetical protein FGO68_gene6052 [Halteria grandinella]|uniref:Cilia- and flagella-associated protein 300 n=1 Tax=Halteria grandinella TaxID=5974 RepID=A0A8J8NIT8_HALGN|nr:hypothetical protein FGO68_gene6052 [Halteria grandinella]
MEITEQDRSAAEERKEQTGFTFVVLPDDGKQFANFTHKDVQAKFFQFNQPFHLIGADNFLKDLFNDKTVLSTFNPVAYTLNCNSVKYKKLNAEVINLAWFDFLIEKGIVMDDYRIKADYDEYFEGIQLSDRLRKAMLWEESEYYCELQDDKIQNEFIYKLFQMVFIGGSMCQFDENLKEYLEVIKKLYKDLITVAKDPETGEIKVMSQVFLIEQIDGLDKLFPMPYHPQNWFFVIVDPIHWHCTFLYHKWTSFW